MVFFANILMSWGWSRLQHKAREKWLIYSLQWWPDIQKDYIAVSFKEDVKKDNLIPLMKLIIDEMKDVLSWKVTQAEIDRVKWRFEWNSIRNFSTQDDLNNFYIWKCIRKEFGLDYKEYIKAFLSLWIDDLKEFSKIFNFENWTIWLIWKDAWVVSEELRTFAQTYSKK